ncbi:hypothetical protein [Rhodoferax sp.]|uniref:hypothetical protein n=1 Tax=Rhodoferax sp. TaxID=50421 RepID=UPI0026094587|nr:hypothetical protein [Rhodoferax sp.]MDD2919495.1 hypothetical protein [Rhodoferax sp.]
MHPLLELLLARPQLLADHALAYGELFTEELAQARSAWQRWALWRAAALCGLLLATLLAGVALMLWAALPASGMPMPWLLLLTPMLPLAAALSCWGVAQQRGSPQAFALMRGQMNADMAMLRAARPSP